MALKFTYTTPQGFDAPEAYVRIVSTQISEGKDEQGQPTGEWFAVVGVQLYKDKASRDAGLAPIGAANVDRFKIPLGPGDINPILAQLYQGLKDLDLFSGATEA